MQGLGIPEKLEDVRQLSMAAEQTCRGPRGEETLDRVMWRCVLAGALAWVFLAGAPAAMASTGTVFQCKVDGEADVQVFMDGESKTIAVEQGGKTSANVLGRQGRFRIAVNKPVWAGFGMMSGLALAMVPDAAFAQGGAVYMLIDTTNKEVREAIQRHLTRLVSSIKAADITVTNVRVEDDFATADVTGKAYDYPIVFLKKAERGHKWEDGHFWKVIFAGSGMGPGVCRDLGFPSNSKLCRN